MEPLNSLISSPPHASSRLRIALVTETYPPEINGVALTLKHMVDGLRKRGHQVELIRPRQAHDVVQGDTAPDDDILVPGFALPRYSSLRTGLPQRRRLMRAWREQRPDLVHVATEGPLGWSAAAAARRLGLPVTSDFHTNFDHYSAHYGMRWLKRPIAAYLRAFHNRTALTFVPTREMVEHLLEQGYRDVEVVARGIDTARFTPARRSAALRAAWGVGQTGLAVLSVGRLAAEKNLELTLRSFAAVRSRHPEARLILVGDGPLRPALERAHPDIFFAGMCKGNELAAHYASADLFLFPSLSETFGNVTLEALASGLALVAYDYAAAREHVRHAHNGLVVPCGDSAAFIAAAVELAGDAALRQHLGRHARASAAGLSWDTINDRFAALLLHACRAHRSRPPCHPAPLSETKT